MSKLWKKKNSSLIFQLLFFACVFIAVFFSLFAFVPKYADDFFLVEIMRSRKLALLLCISMLCLSSVFLEKIWLGAFVNQCFQKGYILWCRFLKYFGFECYRSKSVSNLMYLFLLLGYATLDFCFFVPHTAFEWTTTQDIPLILRLIDPEILKNDFYTDSLMESPRFIFSYFIYGLTKTGLPWYDSLYLSKVTFVLLIPGLMFMVMTNVFQFWKPANVCDEACEKMHFLFFIFCMGVFSPLQTVSPFGWRSILTFKFLSPMTLSFTIGLGYMAFKFKAVKHRMPIAASLLFCCTVFHPVIGLFHFIIVHLFILTAYFDKQKLIQLGFDFIFGVVLPIVFLMVKYGSSYSISAERFIQIYVNLRHPHHYLMSDVVGLPSLIWLCLLLIPLCISIHMGSIKMTILSSLTFLFCGGAPLLQFLGTEVFNIKRIAQLGPSRFSAYYSIILMLNLTIVLTIFFSKNPTWFRRSFDQSILGYMIRSMHKFLCVIEKRFLSPVCKRGYYIAAVLVTVLSVWSLTIDSQLVGNVKSGNKLIEWVHKNTPAGAVFFVRGFDTFLLRVYGNRAVFIDRAFPFNEKYIEGFAKRYAIYLESSRYKFSDYELIARNYRLDYLLLPSEETIGLDYPSPVYFDKNWSVYSFRR
jgi:hypothetical protein